MLKRLAILALVLWCINGARSQVPRDGSGQHDKAQDKQETANPSKPVAVGDSHHGANNQEQAAEKPTKYPWGELLAPANIPNWFLAAVGGVTGWFVYKTLKAIKKQADIMEAQARDARESSADAARIALATAKAAQKSADAAMAQINAMKAKERARLSIEPKPLQHFDVEVPFSNLYTTIENFGDTHALNVVLTANMSVVKEGMDEPTEADFWHKRTQSFDRIRTGEKQENWHTIPTGSDCDVIKPGAKKLVAHFWGVINYEDIFGDSHVTTYRFVLGIMYLGEITSKEGSDIIPVHAVFGWEKCPHPEHNHQS